MKPCKKLFAVLIVMSAVLIQPEISFSGRTTDCPISFKNVRRAISHNFPFHPLRKEYRSDTSLTCGQNALCGTLDGTFNWVYGQVGIYYRNTDLGRPVFVPLYVREAAFSNDGYLIPYMIPKWDGKVFWMNINPNKPPIWIQPYYLDNDPSCAGCMKFISRAMLYKEKNKDYSDYPYGAALMYMYVSVDADFTVKSYTIDVYDQDDKLAQRGLKLNIGDEVQTIYVEDDDDDDSPDWDAVTLEGSVPITQEPKFEYAGYIPGRDFGCGNCKIDLSQADLFFRIVGYTEKTRPTYSARTALGKLRDNACAAYPNLTTASPGLSDVVEGLRILASLAP